MTRSMRALLACLAALLTLPAAADAWVRPPAPDPPAPHISAGCPDSRFEACVVDGTIYALPGLASELFAHEEGHVQDSRELSDGERNRYRYLLGMSYAAPWSNGTADVAVTWKAPNERFAMDYAFCRSAGPGEGYVPRRRRGVTTGDVCRFIARVLANDDRDGEGLR